MNPFPMLWSAQSQQSLGADETNAKKSVALQGGRSTDALVAVADGAMPLLREYYDPV